MNKSIVNIIYSYLLSEPTLIVNGRSVKVKLVVQNDFESIPNDDLFYGEFAADTIPAEIKLYNKLDKEGMVLCFFHEYLHACVGLDGKLASLIGEDLEHLFIDSFECNLPILFASIEKELG